VRNRRWVSDLALLKLATGRGREVHPLIHTFAVLFLLRYVFLR
jgi:xanthine/uracil/vitamin C permease (AzgA family)